MMNLSVTEIERTLFKFKTQFLTKIQDNPHEMPDSLYIHQIEMMKDELLHFFFYELDENVNHDTKFHVCELLETAELLIWRRLNRNSVTPYDFRRHLKNSKRVLNLMQEGTTTKEIFRQYVNILKTVYPSFFSSSSSSPMDNNPGGIESEENDGKYHLSDLIQFIPHSFQKNLYPFSFEPFLENPFIHQMDLLNRTIKEKVFFEGVHPSSSSFSSSREIQSFKINESCSFFQGIGTNLYQNLRMIDSSSSFSSSSSSSICVKFSFGHLLIPQFGLTFELHFRSKIKRMKNRILTIGEKEKDEFCEQEQITKRIPVLEDSGFGYPITMNHKGRRGEWEVYEFQREMNLISEMDQCSLMFELENHSIIGIVYSQRKKQTNKKEEEEEEEEIEEDCIRINAIIPQQQNNNNNNNNNNSCSSSSPIRRKRRKERRKEIKDGLSKLDVLSELTSCSFIKKKKRELKRLKNYSTKRKRRYWDDFSTLKQNRNEFV